VAARVPHQFVLLTNVGQRDSGSLKQHACSPSSAAKGMASAIAEISSRSIGVVPSLARAFSLASCRARRAAAISSDGLASPPTLRTSHPAGGGVSTAGRRAPSPRMTLCCDGW
jgi:hypothetical protein